MIKCKIENCNNPKSNMKKGFCNYHYQKQYNEKRSKEYKQKSNVKFKREKVSGSKMIDFFKSLQFEIPNNCQCCGNSLNDLKVINFTICLAHILPKSKEDFFIISTNKHNIVYLCDVCHNGFDNKGESWFEKQNETFKNLIKNRVKYLSNYLTEQQQTKIKEYLIK